MEAIGVTETLPRLDADAGLLQPSGSGGDDGATGWFGRLLARDEATLLATF